MPAPPCPRAAGSGLPAGRPGIQPKMALFFHLVSKPCFLQGFCLVVEGSQIWLGFPSGFQSRLSSPVSLILPMSKKLDKGNQLAMRKALIHPSIRKGWKPNLWEKPAFIPRHRAPHSSRSLFSPTSKTFLGHTNTSASHKAPELGRFRTNKTILGHTNTSLSHRALDLSRFHTSQTIPGPTVTSASRMASYLSGFHTSKTILGHTNTSPSHTGTRISQMEAQDTTFKQILHFSDHSGDH